MFDQYRQRWAEGQQFWQVARAMRRAEPWRFVTLPISLALALFLEWALEWSGPHSLTFWWLTAFGVSAVMLGSVHLALYVRARWERQPHQKENR